MKEYYSKYMSGSAVDAALDKGVEAYGEAKILKESLTESRKESWYKNPINLGHKSVTPMHFRRGSFLTNGLNFNENSNRAVTDVLLTFPEGEKVYMYNFGENLYDLLKVSLNGDGTYTIVDRIDETYRLSRAYYEFTSEKDVYYVLISQNADRQSQRVTDETLENLNANMVVCTGSLNRSEVAAVSKRTNLWDSKAASDGYYVDYNSGVKKANTIMSYVENLPCRSGEILHIKGRYYMIAFFDYNGRYISGAYGNYEAYNKYPDNANDSVTVPGGAVSLAISTRTTDSEVLVVSEVGMGAKTKVKEASYVPVLAHQIKRADFATMYDWNFEKGLIPNETPVANSEIQHGKLVINSEGRIRSPRHTTIDRSKISAVFCCTSDAEIKFGYDAVPWYASSPDGCFALFINAAEKTMKAYKCQWDNFDAHNVKVGETSFTHDIADGKMYSVTIDKRSIYEVVCEMICADTGEKIAELTITSYVDPNNENIQRDQLRCWGSGRLDVITGIAKLSRFSMYSTGDPYSRVMIIGDSYVENNSRAWGCSYARRLYDALDGKVFISGRGGAASDDILNRITYELNFCAPEYCIINTGVNDRSIGFEAYKTNMESIISILENAGIEPVLITCPRVMDDDNVSTLREINQWVKGAGYKYIDVAMALSTGDGETMDSSKYQTDNIHPNIKGGECIFNWIRVNLPELLY